MLVPINAVLGTVAVPKVRDLVPLADARADLDRTASLATLLREADATAKTLAEVLAPLLGKEPDGVVVEVEDDAALADLCAGIYAQTRAVITATAEAPYAAQRPVDAAVSGLLTHLDAIRTALDS